MTLNLSFSSAFFSLMPRLFNRLINDLLVVGKICIFLLLSSRSQSRPLCGFFGLLRGASIATRSGLCSLITAIIAASVRKSHIEMTLRSVSSRAYVLLLLSELVRSTPINLGNLAGPFDYLPGCHYPGGSSLNQAPADTCAIAYSEHVGYLGLQILGQLESR